MCAESNTINIGISAYTKFTSDCFQLYIYIVRLFVSLCRYSFGVAFEQKFEVNECNDIEVNGNYRRFNSKIINQFID